jgi:hypothetical protein
MELHDVRRSQLGVPQFQPADQHGGGRLVLLLPVVLSPSVQAIAFDRVYWR